MLGIRRNQIMYKKKPSTSCLRGYDIDNEFYTEEMSVCLKKYN